jgi:hypothetical protein
VISRNGPKITKEVKMYTVLLKTRHRLEGDSSLPDFFDKKSSLDTAERFLRFWALYDNPKHKVEGHKVRGVGAGQRRRFFTSLRSSYDPILISFIPLRLNIMSNQCVKYLRNRIRKQKFDLQCMVYTQFSARISAICGQIITKIATPVARSDLHQCTENYKNRQVGFRANVHRILYGVSWLSMQWSERFLPNLRIQ